MSLRIGETPKLNDYHNENGGEGVGGRISGYFAAFFSSATAPNNVLCSQSMLQIPDRTTFAAPIETEQNLQYKNFQWFFHVEHTYEYLIMNTD